MTFLKSKKKCLFRSFTFIIQNSLCAGGTGGAAAFEATEALWKSAKPRPVGFLIFGWDIDILRPALFSCWTGLKREDAGIFPPPGTMGKLVGGTFLMRCSGTSPRWWPDPDGEVGDIEGVVELEHYNFTK